MDALTEVPFPVNEPVLDYSPGSAERKRLEAVAAELSSRRADLPCTIGGERRMGGCEPVEVVQPHRHNAVLGTLRGASARDAADAIEAARQAAPAWRALPFDERTAIMLRAAELLSGPWRAKLNAATMLGQSKTPVQAEIDAACELIDFWRFNAFYARRVLAEQPFSGKGSWNRMDYRPLEGFVYAITPFNFTSIAGNLPTAPALMGNVVLWKPSPAQTLAAQLTLELLEEAGLPPGVINLLTGDGRAVSDVVLRHPDLAGIHFTGSTATFRHLWSRVGANIGGYRGYPRLVGETGGKDFVLAHPSADVDVLRTALVRGAFEYQGQKCSAASRAFVPKSLWRKMSDDLVSEVESLPMGDVLDFRNFLGALIDQKSYKRLSGVIEAARSDDSLQIVAGGQCDDSVGYFVRPTVLLGSNPGHEVFRTEYFGPLLAIYVYDDTDYREVLKQVESGTSYGLTGSFIGSDRSAVAEASKALRFAAGNFYINDKPTGAIVGQQPFGGSRASGTNDKAGSIFNLLRWVSPRSIKESFAPAVSYRYLHQGSASRPSA